MRLKKIKDFLINNEISMHERLFVLIMSVTIISWVLTLIEIMVFGGTLSDIVLLIIGTILFAAVVILSVKLDRIKVGAMIISAGMVFLYLPCTFFFGGGIYGDAPLWFLFSVVLINISLSGRAKFVFITLDALVAAGCWVVSYSCEVTV